MTVCQSLISFEIMKDIVHTQTVIGLISQTFIGLISQIVIGPVQDFNI